MSVLVSGNTAESPHGLRAGLVKLQALAGALFAVFVILHLSNVALAPLGIETFNSYQRTLRAFYQFPLVEIALVTGPLIIHLLAGIWLYLLDSKRVIRRRRPLSARLHSWAGGFLLLVIFGHILAVRGPSFFYDVFPEFEGIAFSLWYFPAWFYPYYFLLAVAGFYHTINGLRRLAVKSGHGFAPAVTLTMTGIAALWFAVSLAALGGLLFDVGDPSTSDFALLGEKLFGLDIHRPWR